MNQLVTNGLTHSGLSIDTNPWYNKYLNLPYIHLGDNPKTGIDCFNLCRLIYKEQLDIKIPYDTGMDPYSGLVDLFEKKGLLVKSGNRLKYVDSKGKEYLEYRKAWSGDKLKMLMDDFDAMQDNPTAKEIDDETE